MIRDRWWAFTLDGCQHCLVCTSPLVGVRSLHNLLKCSDLLLRLFISVVQLFSLQTHGGFCYAFCILSRICIVFPSAFPIGIASCRIICLSNFLDIQPGTEFFLVYFAPALRSICKMIGWWSMYVYSASLAIADPIFHLRKVFTPPVFAATTFRRENTSSNMRSLGFVSQLP